MWTIGHCPKDVLVAKTATKQWSSKSPEPSRPVPSAQPRPQVQKRRRRQGREKTILSAQHNKVGGQTLNCSEKQKIAHTAQTPAGTKKDNSFPFPSSYSQDYVESFWYQWWEKEGFFNPDQHERLPHRVDQTFSLCILPPNVTGTLHLGHALTVAVHDALILWRRLQVTEFCGCLDVTMVELQLRKGEEIYHQLRRLGASLDWSRACFTMDPGFSRAVTEAFVRHRSEGLVN